MGDVTGPISTLPGSTHHSLPEGTMCDEHPDRPAVVRVQGETDSFGSEMNDLCQECWDAEREWRRSGEARSGECDWCKQQATDLSDTRDYEEGMAGPVYRVCGACRKRRDDRDRAYLDQFDDYDGDYDDLDAAGEQGGVA